MPGKTNTGCFYWDACVFFAWLKDEQRARGELQGVREHVERLKKNEIKIMTSSLTLTEVRRGRLTDPQMGIFERVLRRRNLGLIDIDRRIGSLAGQMKDYYGARKEENNGKVLSTPDAIHLATAVVYGADAFHTFDGKDRKGTLGLLPLSGNVAGHQLLICHPPTGAQAELPL